MKEPRLYILMRTDMASMTPGRACAQAAHAQSEFEAYIDTAAHAAQRVNTELFKDYDLWKGNYNFGTVIILGAEYSQIEYFFLESFEGYRGRVIDPEYSVADGFFTHKVPNVLTCAWAFCDKELGDEVFSMFELYDGPDCRAIKELDRIRGKI
jgi:hypothetical protein